MIIQVTLQRQKMQISLSQLDKKYQKPILSFDFCVLSL